MKAVGTTANILAGMITCEIDLISICGGGSVDIWLMCKGNCVWSDTTIDQRPWCKCSWCMENQSMPIWQLWEKSKPQIIGLSKCLHIMNCC